jgi:large subunit ribosomal protein L30
MEETKKYKITLVRSLIGRSEHQRKIVKSIGLRKIGSSVIQNDSPGIRGVIHKIGFMLKVEEI